MNGVRVRAFVAGDGAALAAVQFRAVREGARADYTEAQTAAWMPAPRPADWYEQVAADGRTTFVAVDALDRVVGYIDLEPDGHIDHLFCDPSVTGCGVSSALYAAVEATAKERGLPRLYVEASEAAKRLFERRGFAVVARQDLDLDGVAIHNFVMELRRV